MKTYNVSYLNFGKNLHFFLKFSKRSELVLFNSCFCFEKYESFKYIFMLLRNDEIFKLFYFLNLLMYQLLFCYKGFRFFFNLPVNGQRTWSNGKSTSYLNKKFLIFRFFYFKKQFVNLSFNNMYYMFFLEFLNLFWKLNFFEEWLYCYINITKKIKLQKAENNIRQNSNLIFNKDYIFLNLLNIKNKTFRYSGNMNTIGFLPGKYRIIILN